MHFPDFTLGPLSFDLAPGERVALVGPNGAGKSTTMRALAGRLSDYSGSITVDGIEARDDGAAWRARAGVLPEHLLGFGWMTVTEHLDFLSCFFKGWDAGYARALRERLGLSPTSKLGTLSKGMRLKLSFIAAEAYRPPMLLLDEPTSGLDPVVRNELLGAIRDVGRNDATRIVLFSTHILEDVEAVAQRVILLRDGQLMHDHSIRDLADRQPGRSLSTVLLGLLTNEQRSLRRAAER